MFRLPNLPSPRAEIHELADFVELLCWCTRTTSAQTIIRYLGRNEENDVQDGCEDSDDENSTELDVVMNEISFRASACNGGYPFSLSDEGTIVRINDKAIANDPIRTAVYQYLLLSTRLNMQANRKHAKIDGTTLLEKISAHAIKQYLGHERAESLVFGTSEKSKFDVSIKNLCKSLGEGGGFQNPDEAPVSAKDGNLDVVAWTPFQDKLPSKMIIFAQCKTGSSWRDTVHELQPLNFCKKWFLKQPIVCPTRAFCIAESANKSRWNTDAIDAGLLFDRCRIVELSSGLDQNILTKIEKWNKAAFKFAKPHIVASKTPAKRAN